MSNAFHIYLFTFLKNVLCGSSQSFPLVSLKGVMGCTTLSLQKWTQCLLALTYRAYHNLPLFEVLN